MSINELRSITTFVRTAELGSLSRAAEVQEISPQAASKALAQLEAHLGVRLFHRTTRSMALTEEGARFLEAVRPALASLQQALGSVRQTREEIAGPLRIVGPRSVLQTVIGPVMDEFCRLYPRVQPDVMLDDRIGNWVEERIDVGFRLGSAPQEGLVARRLFGLQLVICAAPSYLRRYGVPRTLEALAGHRCSVFRSSTDGRLVPWQVQVGACVELLSLSPALATNDEAFELRATLAGEVVAQLAMPTAAPHIRAGRLVPLLPTHLSEAYSLFVYYGSRSAMPARVRCFIDLVSERLAGGLEFRMTLAALEAAWAQGVAGLPV
ncbi:LysR substrate-binding domain-containing protein [Zoogloea sp.]|uniref:LysR family transcriptional regulator n=1 Tax=Zoogloea sp. TaxID=49181 RepID=UPI0035B1B334